MSTFTGSLLCHFAACDPFIVAWGYGFYGFAALFVLLLIGYIVCSRSRLRQGKRRRNKPPKRENRKFKLR